MSQHPNARLTPPGRAELVARVGSGTPVAEAASQMDVSRQTASKWLSRARRGESMSDRPCRPARLARSTPPADAERVLEARRSMLLAPLALAAVTGVPARTRARIVARSGLPRLADVNRVTTDNRSAYRSSAFAGELASRVIAHKFMNPFSPWQNGTVERMNRALAQEWQYARALQLEASVQRVRGTSADVTHTRRKQCHGT